MSKVVKLVASISYTKSMGAPPAHSYAEAGVIDPLIVSLVTDPASARFDPRPFVTANVLKLATTLNEDDLLNATALAWLPQRVTFEDGTSEVRWALEPVDGRTRTAACRMIQKSMKYTILKDAHLLSDRRLNELATVANTARTDYTPAEIAEKGPRMFKDYMADKTVKSSEKSKDAAYKHVSSKLGVSVAEFTLIMDNYGKLSDGVKEKLESGELKPTAIRDLAAIPTAAQDAVIEVAAKIEDATVEIQEAEGKGGKRTDSIASTDAIRAAKSLLSGEALPESAQRNEARTKATEKVAKELGVKPVAKSGRITTEEIKSAITTLSTWRVTDGKEHDDNRAVGVIIDVLKWLEKGEASALLHSLGTDSDVVKLMNAQRL